MKFSKSIISLTVSAAVTASALVSLDVVSAFTSHHSPAFTSSKYSSITPSSSSTSSSSSTRVARVTRVQQSTDSSQEQLSITDITQELNQHKIDFDTKLSAATTVQQAEAIRIEYLGKKGPINQVMSYMRILSNEDKPKLGAVVNSIKVELEQSISTKKSELELVEIEQSMKAEQIDVTLPGLAPEYQTGKRHPLSMTMEKAVDIFLELGYDTVTDVTDSPEIEEDYYCFQALNCPQDHPARDMQDTFYLTDDMGKLLRTHTSAVQIRQLANRTPPLRIVAPGRVYRKDDIDATHSMIFHQIEILALDERGKLNLGHLKGTVEHFLKQMFGPNIQVRFRGSYFPFTEPSMEVDVFFRGKWLEVLGCGMVDPNVLEMAGLDPTKVSGFAAGFGVERFAMVIHDINDIREFYKNDFRFLDQFPHFYNDGILSMLAGKDGKDDAASDGVIGGSLSDAALAMAENENEKQEEQDAQQQQQQQQKKKKEKKQAPAAAASTDIDISKLDIRVGTITKVWEHEEADKLYCEEIDIGEEDGPRSIASGLRPHYSLEEMEGQRVLVLANLKTRKMMGFPSHGMVLCAVSDDGSSVKFIEPPVDAKVGERVTFDGFDGEPATENQILKKKMLDKIFPDLKTNSDGQVTYKDVVMSTSAGPCVAQDNMSNCAVG